MVYLLSVNSEIIVLVSSRGHLQVVIWSALKSRNKDCQLIRCMSVDFVVVNVTMLPGTLMSTSAVDTI